LKVARKANSESGIPADILDLHFGESVYPPLDWLRICILAPIKAIGNNSFDCYLVEMGIDEPTPPKNMKYLLTILRPDIGIILNALPVHAQQFGSVTAIAKEKGKLITGNQNLKYAILNADQPEIASLKPTSGASIITFGEKKNSDIAVESITSSLKGTLISLFINHPPAIAFGDSRWRAGKSYFINLRGLALPEFYGHTIAAALAVAFALNINLQKASDAISENFKPLPGRGRIFEGIKNTTIIDSSYNASGETMLGSLEMLQHIGKNKIKIAVLGDMRELGLQAESEHKKVAETAIKSADKIVLVGPLMKQFALPVIKKSKLPVEWFATAGESAKFLLQGSHPSTSNFLTGGEIILVKGSQNTIFLEIVVEALLKNKPDVENLCRRGPFWDKTRRPYQ
jgi:UDP-N-acetylmuramoyl-tripeptide--D-alanyl-D-alanine ligase